VRRLPWFGLLAALLGAARPALAQSDDVSRGVSEMRRERRDVDRLGWYVPDYARLQFAGYLGSIGAGGGYALLDDVLNVSLLYGFTPEARAGRDVHALKLALDVRPFDLRFDSLRIVPVYLGGSMFYAFGSQYFTRLPERYQRVDKHYYPPTALHWGAQLGVEVDYVPARGKIERHGLYYELVTVDTYLASLVSDSSTVSLPDVLSSSVGYRCAF
jgi:hypothetical protein